MSPLLTDASKVKYSVSSMNGCLFSFSGRPIVRCHVVCLLERQTLMVITVVAILRVWAMYNRSRLVLGTLLILFSLEIISTVLAISVDSNPKKLPGMPKLAECTLL